MPSLKSIIRREKWEVWKIKIFWLPFIDFFLNVSRAINSRKAIDDLVASYKIAKEVIEDKKGLIRALCRLEDAAKNHNLKITKASLEYGISKKEES